ncbi:hypothetical protein HKD37_07G019366 [Glycine soja]
MALSLCPEMHVVPKCRKRVHRPVDLHVHIAIPPSVTPQCPPIGTYFSRRNATTLFPSSPAFTYIFARSKHRITAGTHFSFTLGVSSSPSSTLSSPENSYSLSLSGSEWEYYLKTTTSSGWLGRFRLRRKRVTNAAVSESLISGEERREGAK